MRVHRWIKFAFKRLVEDQPFLSFRFSEVSRGDRRWWDSLYIVNTSIDFFGANRPNEWTITITSVARKDRWEGQNVHGYLLYKYVNKLLWNKPSYLSYVFRVIWSALRGSRLIGWNSFLHRELLAVKWLVRRPEGSGAMFQRHTVLTLACFKFARWFTRRD